MEDIMVWSLAALIVFVCICIVMIYNDESRWK